MYRYFDYFIKCIIRNLTRLLCKPKVFITILIILLVFSLLSYKSQVQAVYQGDDTYTDKNNTIILAYDTINNDLINRLANCTSSVNLVLQRLKNSNLDYYVYYGDISGSSMVNSSTFNTSRLYIAFYDSSTKVSSTFHDSYQGLQTNIYTVDTKNIYYFENNDIFSTDNTTIFIPNVLISYKNYAVINYINNSSQEQTNDIVSSIQEQTNTIQEQTTKIEEQTQVQQETQDFLKNDNVEEGTVSIIKDNNQDITQSGFDNIFNIIMNAFTSTNYKDIVIPLPYVDKSITIPSNFLLNSLGTSSWIVSFIHLFYYFLVGMFIVKDVEKIIEKVKSGDIMTSTDGNIKADLV